MLHHSPPAPIVARGLIPTEWPKLNKISEKETPWQRVCAKLNLSPRALAKELHRNQSTIQRHINSWCGLIHPWYQVKLLKLAKRRGVILTPDDLFPSQDDI